MFHVIYPGQLHHHVQEGEHAPVRVEGGHGQSVQQLDRLHQNGKVIINVNFLMPDTPIY